MQEKKETNRAGDRPVDQMIHFSGSQYPFQAIIPTRPTVQFLMTLRRFSPLHLFCHQLRYRWLQSRVTFFFAPRGSECHNYTCSPSLNPESMKIENHPRSPPLLPRQRRCPKTFHVRVASQRSMSHFPGPRPSGGWGSTLRGEGRLAFFNYMRS